MEFMDGTWKKEINTWEELVGNNLLNQEAVIEGAVHSIRNMGDVAFIILRRREGLFQTVYENEMANVSIHELKEAMTIRVKGILHEEERAPHGRELRIRHIDILSTPAEPLPMAIDKWKLNTSLEAKLNYRPISLRNIQERSKFKIQDTLADCFELKGVQIYLDQTVEASFGASDSVRGDWSLNVAGNSITLFSVAELPGRCYGKSVRLLLTVGLKSNSDLQQYYVANQDPDVLEAHIYNIATSTFNWIGGEPSSTSKNTEKTRVIVKEKVPKGHITIRKVDETGKALQNGKFQITALEDIDVTGVTVTNVLGCGMQKGQPEYYRGAVVETNLLPKVKVEVVICKVPTRAVIDAAKAALYTGHIGDGKIFVYNIENVVKIRTNEEGYDALQDD